MKKTDNKFPFNMYSESGEGRLVNSTRHESSMEIIEVLSGVVNTSSTQRLSAITKMAEAEEIYKSLPQIDCGSCGAPNCHALAEDIVNGEAKESDCLIKLREILENKNID